MNSGGDLPPPELEAGTDSEVVITPTPSEDEAEKAARTDEEKASSGDASVAPRGYHAPRQRPCHKLAAGLSPN